MFEIKNLKYKDILDIEELTLAQAVVFFMGPSGSGKTTLLRHLNRLKEPDSGEIFYHNKNIKTINPVELRRKVVMLGQTSVIYEGTIADNLQIGARFAQQTIPDHNAMLRMLELVGLNHTLEEGCYNLSGGEKQRLCMARVMLMEAETYLLDEPSAALDQNTEQFMIQNIVDFSKEKGRQLIMVSHSPQMKKMFPQGIVLLEQGKVREAIL